MQSEERQAHDVSEFKGNRCQQSNDKRSGRKDRISGIMVVISSFCIQVLVFGTSNSIGVYNVQFLKAFDAGAAAVSFVGSINLGMLLGAGPVSSFLLTKMSHRRVALIGAVLSSIGLLSMPFAPNLPYMYVFYGIIAGLGFSLVYIPSFILSGLFYDKHRSLATGIVSAGAGLGSTLFPNIFQQLIDFYGWRGSLIIVAGVNLHLIVFVALMRPAPERDADKSNITRDRKTEELNDDPDDRSYPICHNKSLTKANKSDTSRRKVIKPTKSIESLQNDKLTLGIDSNNTITNDIVFEEIGLSSATCYGRKRVQSHSFKQYLRLICTFDFVVYIISNLGWNAGGGILLIFLPTYMTHIGLSEEQASLAFSLFGAFRCFGCVIGGVLGSCTCCDRIYLYILSNVTAGLVTLAYNVSAMNSLFGQICLIALFGFFIGNILSLQISLTCDLVSTDALGFGFGVLMLSNGVGMLTGPPFGGALIDCLDSQLAGITLSGFCTMFGGLVMVVVPICRHKCRRKRRQQNYHRDDTLP